MNAERKFDMEGWCAGSLVEKKEALRQWLSFDATMWPTEKIKNWPIRRGFAP
jgi:hypothetical protein